MDRSGALLRVLGFAFGLAVVVGGMVGQGIMRSPGIVAAAVITPAAILLVWLIAGLLSAIDAFAVSELAASHPCAGGPYAFARRAFGAAGTLVGWTDWLQGVVSVAFIAIVFGEYFAALGIVAVSPGAAAFALLLAVGGLHWTGTKVCGASQTVGTTLKALLMLGLLAALLIAPHAPPGDAPPLSPTLTLAGVVVALRITLTTYAGWNTSAYFCEEMVEPERNVARSTFAGIALVTLLYVAINAALLTALTPAQIAASKLPIAEALHSAFGGSTRIFITALAVVSVAAIVNLMAMQFTRVVFAMSRDGALPQFLSHVSPGGTPRRAMLSTVGAAMLFAISGSYEQLIAVAAVPASIIFLVTDLAAIRLRSVEPDLPRPFRMPLFPLPALAGAAINTLLIAGMVWEDPVNSLFGVLILAVVGAVYAVKPMLMRRAPALARADLDPQRHVEID